MSKITSSVKKSPAAPLLIPIFAAVGLIIACAFYIVFKLTQQTSNKWSNWADYDECGWS